MKLTVVLDPDGEIETIHPNPGEQCNVDDSDRVKHLTLGEVAELVARHNIGYTHHDYEAIDAKMCQHCGAD